LNKLSQHEQQFRELVAAHSGSIYRICRAYLYDKSHVDDLYQEILYQIWRSLGNFKGNAQIGTWIYRIAVNTAITYNLQYRKTALDPLPAQLHVADMPSDIIEKEQKLTQLETALAQLEDQDRLIISLVLEELSYKEIAEICGSNTNTIGVRINRIKARLLKLMNEKNGDDEL
jgi:RNA polymerase sigma factor (sigma-70 family)